MDDAALLVMLKNNLELILDYMDAAARASKEAELTQYLQAAKKFIAAEGITLDLSDIGDCMLTVLYAAWLYEKRKNAGADMSRMLRYNLNNRLFREKLGGSE